MKETSIFLLFRSTILFTILILIQAGTASAEHEIQSLYSKTYNASNSCFPRTFSQIGQFKVSSGGLRNIHPNPRSIICAINSEASNTLYPDRVDGTGQVTYPQGAGLVLSFSALPSDMSCTAYTRDKETSAIVDTNSRTFSAGATSGIVTFGDPYGLEWSNYFDVYSYLQCLVPGNGRIISYTAYFYYEDEV